jgi:two-component system sensor histidine kinase BarA
MKQMKELLRNPQSLDDMAGCKKKMDQIFEDMWESCKISKTSSKLMLYNVEDLLDYGQMESGNFRKNIQQFDVKKAIQEIINVQRYKASDKNINLFLQSREFVDGHPKKDNEPDNFKIVSDQQRLQQIILNLVSNALKFTLQGGYIKVDLELHRNSKKSEGYIKVECEDNGVGISQSNQKKLFKLFGFLNDTKSMNKKGIGLGLAISKKIINQFGGDIKVKSDINEGSTFIFTMKLENEQEFFKEHIVLDLESESEDEHILDKVEKPLILKSQVQVQ